MQHPAEIYNTLFKQTTVVGVIFHGYLNKSLTAVIVKNLID